MRYTNFASRRTIILLYFSRERSGNYIWSPLARSKQEIWPDGRFTTSVMYLFCYHRSGLRKINEINPPTFFVCRAQQTQNAGSYLASVKKLSPQNGGFIRANVFVKLDPCHVIGQSARSISNNSMAGPHHISRLWPGTGNASEKHSC